MGDGSLRLLPSPQHTHWEPACMGQFALLGYLVGNLTGDDIGV